MGEASRTPWLIRIALLAFPRSFRGTYAAEMEDDYAEARAACEGPAARAWLAVKTVADLLVAGCANGAPRRSARSHGHPGTMASVTRCSE